MQEDKMQEGFQTQLQNAKEALVCSEKAKQNQIGIALRIISETIRNRTEKGWKSASVEIECNLIEEVGNILQNKGYDVVKFLNSRFIEIIWVFADLETKDKPVMHAPMTAKVWTDRKIERE